VAGTNASDFAKASTTCPLSPATLAVNATCTISVTFTPGASGARSASVTVTDDATGSPHNLGLSGTGAASTPGASLTPSSLDFGARAVGSQQPSGHFSLRLRRDESDRSILQNPSSPGRKIAASDVAGRPQASPGAIQSVSFRSPNASTFHVSTRHASA
ncbi:MAG: choice-of-anchor D domain-containing protein, partial [Chthoniobacterales bacterium]